MKVLNIYRNYVPPEAVNIMRPSKWGNPFKIGPHGDRTEVIERYRTYLDGRPDLKAQVGELAGKDLVCCCKPLPCHGDVLLELANQVET